MSMQYIHPESFETDVTPSVTTSNSRIGYKFGTLLARKNRTFYFVDELFEHRDSDLFGAIGTRMAPVHKQEAERAKSQYKTYGESPLTYIYDEEDTARSWDDWIETQFSYNGLEVIYDTSYEFKYGDRVEKESHQSCVMDREDIALVECIGAGRMFNDIDQDYDEVYDEELLRLVEEAEQNGLNELY